MPVARLISLAVCAVSVSATDDAVGEYIADMWSVSEQPSGASHSAANTVKMVLCRYKEDMSWLLDTALPDLVSFTIYDKGPENATAVDAVKLQNVGTEGYCFVSFIISNWDRLPDWSVFLQGDALGHMEADRFPAVVTELSDATFPDGIQGYRQLSNVCPVQHGDGNYFLAGRSGGEFPTDWQAVFNRSISIEELPLQYPCGGQFAARRERIRQRPLAFYVQLKELIEARDEAFFSVPRSKLDLKLGDTFGYR
jgi:hypothetical protein